ncbi:MAG: hypothetical protein ACOYEO_04160 [bacterium]|jgi:hypothetical protein
MEKRWTPLKLTGRVLAVLILLWVSAIVAQYVNWVIGRTTQFPLLGIYWGQCLPEFLLLALAGFVLTVPDDFRQRHIHWPKFLLLGIPALVVALFLPFLYFSPLTPYVSAYGKFMVSLLVLSNYRLLLGFGLGWLWP